MRDERRWTPLGIFCCVATQLLVGMSALYAAVWWGRGEGALLALVGLVCWLMTLTAWASHREEHAMSVASMHTTPPSCDLEHTF